MVVAEAVTTEWSADHTTTAASQPAAWELRGKGSLGQGASQDAEMEACLMAEEEEVNQCRQGPHDDEQESQQRQRMES